MSTRRECLTGIGVMAAAATNPLAAFGAAEEGQPGQGHPEPPLRLADFEPRSMLKVPESHVARARYPVIDIHTHITMCAHEKNGVALAADRVYMESPQKLLAVMDRKNIRSLVNLTGGYGQGLADTIAKYDLAYRDRFFTFTEPCYEHWLEPNYPQIQADAIAQAHQQGARGLKLLKTLGLYLRKDITTGPLVSIDDPRFDPMWDACAQHHMPVAIHVADPLAFFTPTDRFNERYEELNHHPDWSFHGRDFPSVKHLLEARNRVIARHPETRFVTLHAGNIAEDLANVAENLDLYPNMCVDIAARIGELGRQPRMARKFFDRYQDRILFGTDATPNADEFPQQLFGDLLYEIYYRFLETDDEYFDYAPAKVPPQGRWRIYGINLPDTILRKVYFENAVRELGLSAHL